LTTVDLAALSAAPMALQRSREMTQVCSREMTQAAVADRDRDG
jgi:hypothetical protein